MENIKIKCPAKINLTLEVLNKRPDGYHNIKSIMQTISLYDYLNIKTGHAEDNEIKLSGNSNNIPYDNTNLVYKAAELYLKTARLNNISIDIQIEKNIPVAAGLAGGSTDAAGTLYGLNKIFNKLTDDTIEKLCTQLGSDLNVCLHGGCILATSRGEITEPLPFVNSEVTLIKPAKLGISAGHAYKRYSEKENKEQRNMTEKLVKCLKNGELDTKYIYNDLEYAVFDEFEELQTIKKVFPDSVMTGSGSTYFMLKNIAVNPLNKDYIMINNLHFIQDGVSAEI